MNCPFCAETIQDAAVLCRFCGARKEGDAWQPAAKPPKPRPGHFTIRTSAVLLALSAAFQLVSLTSPVPLFGAMRGGLAAVVYNGLFVGLFATAGLALWRARPWAPRVVYGLAGICTLDNLRYLADGAAREADSAELLTTVGGLVDRSAVTSIMELAAYVSAAVAIASWLGLALYVYVRRAYFAASPPAG